MNPQLEHFQVSPTVLPAGEPVTVTITGCGDYYRFFDDVTYTVQLCPKELHDTEIDEDFTLGGYDYRTVPGTCQNGVLSFTYTFIGEQEWEVLVFSDEKQAEHDNIVRKAYGVCWGLPATMSKWGLNFRVYSLLPDLYKTRVYAGDLHVHSDASDGQEAPEIVCANYRALGNDFMALTDHHYYPSSLRAKKSMEPLSTGFTVFPGEEVHNKYLGRFHIVHFNGQSSINEIILSNREAVKEEVKALSRKLEGLSPRDAEEVAWYQWVTEKIRERGGLSILAHPFWSCRHCYNCPTHITTEVIRRGYYDILEILGGCTPGDNNLQTAFYQELRAEGQSIPIAGSTDCHSTAMRGKNDCDIAKTLVFATAPEEIPQAIMNLFSVAVEQLPGESPHIYGPFRLVKYARFLLENYFPQHNRLCQASGTLLREYFLGNPDLKPAIEAAEQQITLYANRFFHKNNK